MIVVLRPFCWKFVLVFFNDVFIYNNSWTEHLSHVRAALLLLEQHQLFLKCSKCFFVEHNVVYLCHIISADGVVMGLAKVKAVEA